MHQNHRELDPTDNVFYHINEALFHLKITNNIIAHNHPEHYLSYQDYEEFGDVMQEIKEQTNDICIDGVTLTKEYREEKEKLQQKCRERAVREFNETCNKIITSQRINLTKLDT